MEAEQFIRIVAKWFSRYNIRLYKVGGCVRDGFLDRPCDDFDFTSRATPVEASAILGSIPEITNVTTVGIECGTVEFRHEGNTYQHTTYRGEVYPTNSRKPKVVFGESLLEDLARRDFTVNAIAQDAISGVFFDPFDGRVDIKEKVIKCVGSDVRLDEDPVRMLRAIRFACQLDFRIEMEMLHPARLTICSKERITMELNKILLSHNASLGIKLLCGYGLMPYVIPEIVAMQDVEQNRFHIKNVYNHTLEVLDRATHSGDLNDEDRLVLALAALLHDIAKPATMSVEDGVIHFYKHQIVGADMSREILKNLHYTTDVVERVSKLVGMHMAVIELADTELTPRVIRRFVRKVNSDLDLLFALALADVRASNHNTSVKIKSLKGMVDEEMATSKPLEMDSPLTGTEIMEILGLKPGVTVGKLKNMLTDAVIDGVIEPGDKDAAREYLPKFMERLR